MAALAVCSAALGGQEAGPPAPAPPAALPWRLIADFEQEPSDTLGLVPLCGIPLSAQQEAQLRALRTAYHREKADLLRSLGQRYAGKARDVLAQDQKARYDGVLDALGRLARDTDAARSGLAEAVGEGAVASFASDLDLSTVDLARFLDVSEEKREQLREAGRQAEEAAIAALQERLDPASWSDPAAWQEQRKRYREAQQKAQADLAERRKAILTPDELAALEKLETAAAEYRRRLQAARRQAYEDLSELLAPATEPPGD